MKRAIANLAAVAMTAAFVLSCAPKAALKVTVSNDSELDRAAETIELDVESLSVAAMELTTENLIVLDKKGNQIPCQVYTEFNGAKTLVFQACVPAGKTVDYYLAAGERAAFDTLAYSRYVPERLDDYAYENNKIAGRIYGPALDSPKTFGSDIWAKNTDRLVVNERFKRGHYHDDHGDGMDCYKVGNTLGGGALVPLATDEAGNEVIVLGDNWATQAHVTDGPVRTKAHFTYGPFEVNGVPVTAVRELTIDAGSHFAMWATKFELQAEKIPVVLGAIQHKIISKTNGENYIEFTEQASDSKHPDKDGNICVALVMDPAVAVESICEIQNHACMKAVVPAGKVVKTWTGSGWSHADVPEPADWEKAVKDFAYSIANPLKVVVGTK